MEMRSWFTFAVVSPALADSKTLTKKKENGQLHSPSLITRAHEDSLNPQCDNPLEKRKKPIQNTSELFLKINQPILVQIRCVANPTWIQNENKKLGHQACGIWCWEVKWQSSIE